MKRSLKNITLVIMVLHVMTSVINVNHTKTVKAEDEQSYNNVGQLKIGTYIEAGEVIRPGEGSNQAYYIKTW